MNVNCFDLAQVPNGVEFVINGVVQMRAMLDVIARFGGSILWTNMESRCDQIEFEEFLFVCTPNGTGFDNSCEAVANRWSILLVGNIDVVSECVRAFLSRGKSARYGQGCNANMDG